jgi:hypothetical protein
MYPASFISFDGPYNCFGHTQVQIPQSFTPLHNWRNIVIFGKPFLLIQLPDWWFLRARRDKTRRHAQMVNGPLSVVSCLPSSF